MTRPMHNPQRSRRLAFHNDAATFSCPRVQNWLAGQQVIAGGGTLACLNSSTVCTLLAGARATMLTRQHLPLPQPNRSISKPKTERREGKGTRARLCGLVTTQMQQLFCPAFLHRFVKVRFELIWQQPNGNRGWKGSRLMHERAIQAGSGKESKHRNPFSLHYHSAAGLLEPLNAPSQY